MKAIIFNYIRALHNFATSTTKTEQIILRMLAALVGGYGVTYSALAALALLLPWSRVDVVFFSALFPGFFWLGALLWAFVAPTAQRAWRDILRVTIFCSILAVAAVWVK